MVGAGQHGQLDAVQEKDVLVSPELCSGDCPCSQEECQLCRRCLSAADLRILRAAWRERSNQAQMLRIFPPPVNRGDDESAIKDSRNPANRKMMTWYREKCKMDHIWCDG